MEARMFDEITVEPAALKAEIAAINARPLPLMDLKYAQAELKARPGKIRKHFGKTRATKPDV
ncbi:hypothetical protein FHX08_000801 [Rhizobium sp. BK529]|uniref:hypothetical protein n=1 Tax=unclassified Rhizobium TaxID=2613769 RepID=UPI001051C3FB|nr:MULTISPECIES: hypothetical protein [unclassified Rhizobium]MBB3590457.1 hypothetical protein [Rhizobium sp. BK529]TCS05147.1 hypothetical protein EV281_103829 [Rhizobium sp. BK418]